jgi:hypothetical protein
MIEQLRQEQTREPDEADVKNHEAEEIKVPFAQPHDGDAQDQGIQTMQPPESFLVQIKPLDQSMAEA